MNNLRRIREDLMADAEDPSEWTQSAVAEKVGCSKRALEGWERSETTPRPFFQKRLARVYKTTVPELGIAESAEEGAQPAQ